MATILARLLRGCWWKHADPIFDRDARGPLYRCPRCFTTWPRGAARGLTPPPPVAPPAELRSIAAWSRWIRTDAQRGTPVLRVRASHLPQWAAVHPQVARSLPTPARIVGLHLAPAANLIATRTSSGESLCTLTRPLPPPRPRHLSTAP